MKEGMLNAKFKKKVFLVTYSHGEKLAIWGFSVSSSIKYCAHLDCNFEAENSVYTRTLFLS